MNDNKKQLQKFIKTYIFLHLLLKSKISIHEMIVKNSQYVDKTISSMKVLSVCLENNEKKFTFSKNNKDILLFNENEKYTTYSSIKFIEIYENFKKNFNEAKNYYDINYHIIQSFEELTNISNIESIKIVI